MLGRSGQPDRVRIARDPDARAACSTSSSRTAAPQPIAGIDRQFWRAFLEVKGRIGRPLDARLRGRRPGAQEALNQLAALAASIKAANGG